MGIFDACLDITGLIGRHVLSLAADYDDAISDDPDSLELVLAEHRAMEDLLRIRASRLAPTTARAMAIGLIPAGAMLCRSLGEVDALLEAVRDWIADMGDPARHARAVTVLRAMGEDVPEARMLIQIDDARLALDIYDATRIIALILLPDAPSVVVGVIDLDDEGDTQEENRLPTLVA